jgi:hypothetical protein
MASGRFTCKTFAHTGGEAPKRSFRLSVAFRKVVDALTEEHDARSLSEYFRGLIYLDATLSGEETDALDKPAWVTRSYGKLIRSTH